MKFTNEELRQATEIMAGCKETGKLGYAIAKNLSKFKAASAEYSDFRDSVLKKYGTIKGNTVTIPPENIDAYREELGGVSEETEDVPVYTISEELFVGGTLNSQQMEALLWMVED